MIWNNIEDIKPEKGKKVIGVFKHINNDYTKSIVGEFYNMQPDALIDRRIGRWMIITHWSELP